MITVLLTSFHGIILFLKLLYLLLKLVQSLSGKTRNNNVHKFILTLGTWKIINNDLQNVHKLDILAAREMLKVSLNLILLPNIPNGNSNAYTNMNNYFDFIKRRGFIYQQVTSLKINNLVKATKLIWKTTEKFKRRTYIHPQVK